MGYRALALLLCTVTATAFACGSDEGDEDTAAATTSGGSTGEGGSSATGGAPPAECPHTGDPILDPTALPACEGYATCRCLNRALVPEENHDTFADCDADNECVPDFVIETGGNFIPETCVSIAEYEGRCLSTCLPAVAGQADLLPQDICGEGDKCVPCYDPFTKEETGACRQSCDPGPIQPPRDLPRCCEDRGDCIDAQYVPEDNADDVKQDSCVYDFERCVPDGFADGSYVAQPCTTSLIGMGGDEYKPGACLHDCLAAVDNFLIQQDDCPDGYKCAPCLDPQNPGTETGACDYLAE